MNILAKLMSVQMILRHVLYVSYLVPASRVRPMVPDVLPLATFDSDRVFISVVSMKCNNVRLARLPWPGFDYDQLNVRTYTTDPNTGNNAVYFLLSGVTSATVSRLTSLLGLPWQRIAFELQVGRDDQMRYSNYRAFGHCNGALNINAYERHPHPELIAPFNDPKSVIDHITGPLIGFIGPKGHTSRFGIRHRSLEVRVGELSEFSFTFLRATGLLEKGEELEPHNVLLVPEAGFTVYLPPRRV